MRSARKIRANRDRIHLGRESRSTIFYTAEDGPSGLVFFEEHPDPPFTVETAIGFSVAADALIQFPRSLTELEISGVDGDTLDRPSIIDHRSSIIDHDLSSYGFDFQDL
ncbi:hypothetical protein MK280_08005 [Myxococcota bacterium]|nr:hypothetical protein [Myxococcota bacterium]